MLDHSVIELVSEIVDGVSIKLYICFLVDCFKSQFIQVARSLKLLILEHISHFVVAEDSILGKSLFFSKDVRLELLVLVILLITLLAIS